MYCGSQGINETGMDGDTGSICKKCGFSRSSYLNNLKQYLLNSELIVVNNGCACYKTQLQCIKCLNIMEKYSSAFGRQKVFFCSKCKSQIMLSKKTETAISMLLARKGLELIEVLQKPKNTDLDNQTIKIKSHKLLAFLLLKVKHIKCGTIYESLASNISKCTRAYCPTCNSNPELKEKAIKYAEERGGQLLTWGGFIKNHSTFSCKNGHKFTTTWHTMEGQESWCRFCVKRFIPEKINKTNEITKAKKSLNGYIAADKKKNLTSDIDLEFVLNAKKSKCHYCDRMATGLDRIENSKGHTKENCIPSCVRCNWTRGSWTSYEVMLEIGKLLQRIDP